MYLVNEKQGADGTYYEMTAIDENGEVAFTKNIHIRSFDTVVNNKIIHMVYNSEMEPIYDAIRFLNFGGMNNKSQNYVLQSVSALKFLYAYLEIYSVKLDEMNKAQAQTLMDFLKGISRKGLLYETEFVTVRKNDTILAYLKTIRKYVDYLGFEDHILLKKASQSSTIILPESDSAISVNTYSVNVKNSDKHDYVPAYVRKHEYIALLKACEKSTTPLRDRIICRLIFEHGIRIGEVLGITLQDIRPRMKDDEPEYTIELRNRLSDSNEQNVKSMMKVLSESTYRDPDYRKKGIGYTPIVISQDLAEELLEYINEAHTNKNKKYMSRRTKTAKADHVPFANPDFKENYYVFLSSIGSVLTGNNWNKHCRKLFIEAGIPVDKDTRKNGLSHKLRHGYSMVLDALGIDDFDRKTLMRHKNLSTTMIYHNPTPEDVEDMQSKLLPQFHSYIFDDEEDD